MLKNGIAAFREVLVEQFPSPKFSLQMFDAVLLRYLPEAFSPPPHGMHALKCVSIPARVLHQELRIASDLTAEHTVCTLLALTRFSRLGHPTDQRDRLHLKAESVERLLRGATSKDRGRHIKDINCPEEQTGQLDLESQRSRCLPTRIVGQGPHLGVLLPGSVH